MYCEEKRYRFEKCLPKDVTPAQSQLINGLYTNNKRTALNRILQEMTMSTQAPSIDPVSNTVISDSGDLGIENERRFHKDVKSDQYTRLKTGIGGHFDIANNDNEFRTINNNYKDDIVASSDHLLLNDDVFVKNATSEDGVNSLERGSFSNSPNSLVECESTLSHDGVSSTTENSRNDSQKSGTVRLKTLIEKALENSLNTKNKKKSQKARSQQKHVMSSDSFSSSWMTNIADDSKKTANSKMCNDVSDSDNNNKNSVYSIKAHIEHVLEAHIKTANSPELRKSPSIWPTNANNDNFVSHEKSAPKIPERQCSTSSGNSEGSFSVQEFVDKVISQTEVISRILTQPSENDNKNISVGCDNLDIPASTRLTSPPEYRYPPRMLQASEHLKSHHSVDKSKFQTGARDCISGNVGARSLLNVMTKETFDRKHATETRILNNHIPANVSHAAVSGSIPYVYNSMSPGVIPANDAYYRPRANTHSEAMRQFHVDKGATSERSLTFSHPSRCRQSPSTLGINASQASGPVLSSASPYPSIPIRSDHSSPSHQHGISKLSPPASHRYHLDSRPVARNRASTESAPNATGENPVFYSRHKRVHSSLPEDIRREANLIPGPYLADQNGNRVLSSRQESVGKHKFVHLPSDKIGCPDFSPNHGYTRKPEYNSLTQADGIQSHSSVRREHIQQRPPSMPNLCMEHARPGRTANMDNGRYLIQPVVASDPVTGHYRHGIIGNVPEILTESHPLDLSLKKSMSPPLMSKSQISDAYRHMTIKSHLEGRVPGMDSNLDNCVRKEADKAENVGMLRMGSNFSASSAQPPKSIQNGNPSNPVDAMAYAAPVKSGYPYSKSMDRNDANPANYPQATPFSQSDTRLDVNIRGHNAMPRVLDKTSGSKSSAVSKHEPVQSILGNHDPDDVLFLLCKLCEQTYGSPYGFRKHFRNRHGFEPQSHHALIQSIAATKSALRVPVGITEYNSDSRIAPSRNINHQLTPGQNNAITQNQGISPRDSKYALSISPPMASSTGDKLKVISSNKNSEKVAERSQPNRDAESDETRYLVCPECSQNFQLNDFGLYKKHCRAHERSRQNFNTAQETAKHIAKKQFYCKQCNASFTSYVLLSQHMSSFHLESNMVDKYKCTHCGMVFEQYSAFSEHMILHGLSSEHNNVPKITVVPTRPPSVKAVHASSLQEVMISPAPLVPKTDTNNESMNTSDNSSHLTPSPQFSHHSVRSERTCSQESIEICIEDNPDSTPPKNLEVIHNHDPAASQISPLSINSKEDTDEGPPKLEIVETVYRHKKFCSSHGKRKGLDPPSLEMIGTKKIKKCSNIFDDGSDDQHDVRSPTTSVASLSMSTSLSLSPGAISEVADNSRPVSASLCETDNESSTPHSGTPSVEEVDTRKKAGAKLKKSPKSEARHQLPFVWDRVTRRQAGKNIKPPDYIQ